MHVRFYMKATISILTIPLFFFTLTPIVKANPDTEYLYVNGKDTTYVEWSKSGTTPYLNAIDTSYIYVATNNKREGYFTFADTTNTPLTCTVDLYAKGAYDDEVGYSSIRIYVYDGSTWTDAGYILITQTTYMWYSKNVFSLLSTQTKVNAGQIYLKSMISGSQNNYVDCARLTITYSSAPTKTWKSITTWQFNLYTRKTNTVSTSNFNLPTRQIQSISVWSFNLPTLAWNNINVWSFSLLSRKWLDISTFIFSMQAIQWNTITSLTTNLITRTWQPINIWNVILTSLGWHTITEWNVNLFTPIWRNISILNLILPPETLFPIAIIAGAILVLIVTGALLWKEK